MKILPAVLLAALVIPAATCSAGWVPERNDFAHEPALYWWRGGFSSDYQTQDIIELVAASRMGDSAFVYEYVMVNVYSGARPMWTDRGYDSYRYNFRGVACLLTTVADRLLGGRELLSLKAETDWWSHILLAHNNSYKLRLSRMLRLALTTRTDFLLAGFAREDRGILFTPRLAFEVVGASQGFEGDSAPMTNRLHVGVGYGNWWGFEGGSHTTGWTFVVGVALLWAN